MATHRLAPAPLSRSRCAVVNVALACVLVTATVIATRATLPSMLVTPAIPRVLGELIGWQLYWITVVTVVEWRHPRALTAPTVVRAGVTITVGAAVPVVIVLTALRAVL